MQDHRRHNTRRARENNNNNNNPPSFSSTLLDAIYRSIDESNDKVHHNDNENDNNMIFYREAKGMKACMIEKWIDEEEHTYEKVSIRRKSMADLSSSRNNNRKNNIQPVLLNSSSSSSESSCGGGFSSSESSESVIIQRPKPIRTSVSALSSEKHRDCAPDGKAKHESSSFVKTKSKALKIYGDLKKVKQPISPGGRLATFLNSIFTAGNAKNNAKKAKISSVYDDERKFKSEQTSTCSSASSFSRSCLSKTPSSRGNNNSSGAKRSVRFYPVSVIVGEDSRPCGQKNVYENHHHQINTATLRNSNSNSKSNSSNEELKFRVMNESRRVEEVARDLLKNYQKKQQQQHDEEEDDDYDDGASCASSDLFELDNLSAIGIERYREELPVYETTYLSTTNRAIANGLFM